MNQIKQINHDTEAAAERLKHLLPSLVGSAMTEVDAVKPEVAALLPLLKQPANPAWTMARIAALLNPYFEKDTPQGIREMEAEDWAVALSDYPKWAIEQAVRWWKSADNPKRRVRPLEGDIEDRIRVEMQFVRDAEAGISMQRSLKRRVDEPAPRPDAAAKARADAIIAEFNRGKVMPR